MLTLKEITQEESGVIPTVTGKQLQTPINRVWL